MAKFRYQAKNMTGQVVQGELDAKTESEARVILRSQKLLPLKVVGRSVGGGKAKSAGTARVAAKELQVFTRQFATLINSGIPVMQGLEILSNTSTEGNLSRALKGIAAEVSQGKRLADAMESYPGAFDKLYVNMVRAGEEGGVLDTVLNRLAIYIEKAAKIKGKVVGAMWYPAGILCVGLLVAGGILTFVIPKFKELFVKSGQQLPALTEMVLGLSNFLIAQWYLVLGGLGGTVFGVMYFLRTEQGMRMFDEIMIDVPLFGTLIQKSAIARFSRTLSTLLSSGVGILEALEISARTVGNRVIERSLLRAKVAISEGKSITVPLSKEKYMPEMVVQMIGVGEQTGALDQMLGKIADFYEDEVDTAVGALTSVVEPILMVFLGGTIAILVIAMYLPVFNLANATG